MLCPLSLQNPGLGVIFREVFKALEVKTPCEALIPSRWKLPPLFLGGGSHPGLGREQWLRFWLRQLRRPGTGNAAKRNTCWGKGATKYPGRDLSIELSGF